MDNLVTEIARQKNAIGSNGIKWKLWPKLDVTPFMNITRGMKGIGQKLWVHPTSIV